MLSMLSLWVLLREVVVKEDEEDKKKKEFYIAVILLFSFPQMICLKNHCKKKNRLMQDVLAIFMIFFKLICLKYWMRKMRNAFIFFLELWCFCVGCYQKGNNQPHNSISGQKLQNLHGSFPVMSRALSLRLQWTHHGAWRISQQNRYVSESKKFEFDRLWWKLILFKNCPVYSLQRCALLFV